MTISRSAYAMRTHIPLCLFLFGSLVAQSALGGFAAIDVFNGPEDDLAASGRFLSQANGENLASWTLQSTVEGTDFSNAHVGGGSHGLQYTMLNLVSGSDDINSVLFSLSPVADVIPQISLSQSPVFNDPLQWNGGNLPTDIAEFTLTWSGGGTAVVNDPAGQFQIARPLNDDSDAVAISTGTTLTFSDFQIFNSDDVWSIFLPEGATEIQLDWGSSQPTPGSDLTREWVAFDVNFASAVPEPSAALTWLIAVPLLLLSVRRQSRRASH